MWRRMLIMGLVLITACAPSGGDTPVSSTQTTTSPVPSTTNTSTAPPSTTTATPTTIQITGPEAEFAVELPGVVEKVVLGDIGIIALGYDEPDQMLWVTTDRNSWLVTNVRDLFGDEYLWVTDVAVFGGRFVASVVGELGVGTGTPTLLVSDDGAAWRAEPMAAAAHLQTVAFAPDSPPHPGVAGVSDLDVFGGELYAAGWIAAEATSSSVVWKTADGQLWESMVLPNITYPNEWAADLSVGTLGMLVAIGGPVHSGAGAQYSSDGGEWTTVDEVDGWAAVSVSQNEGLLAILRFDLNDSFKYELLTSEDGQTWQSSPPLPVDFEGAALSSGSSWDPMVFARRGPVEALALDPRGWSSVGVGDWDQIIDVTENYLIAAGDGRLLFVNRHP